MMDPIAPARPIRRVSWVARVVGPLALIIVLIAVVVLISSSAGNDDSTTPTPADNAKASQSKNGPETPKTYVVQSGDSLTAIADQFGLSVKRLERLNPDVDAQTLNEGTEITLR